MDPSDFIKSRQKQIQLLEECIKRPNEIKTLLKDYPKLLNGIETGIIQPEYMIVYLQDALCNYSLAQGDHEIKKFESDKTFSQRLANDTNFYKRKGLTPPTRANIEEASRVAKQKMKARNDENVEIRKITP